METDYFRRKRLLGILEREENNVESKLSEEIVSIWEQLDTSVLSMEDLLKSVYQKRKAETTKRQK